MKEAWQQAFDNPKGEGDARPTAMEVIDEEGVRGQWQGRVVLVTGAAGLGGEAAKALVETGAKVYVTARNLDKARRDLGAAASKVHLIKMDQSSLADVRRAATEFLAREDKLHVFVANAAIYQMKHETSADGFEMHLAVNHLAHFLLFLLLRPALLAATSSAFQSRVVVVGSNASRRFKADLENMNLEGEGVYNGYLGYGASKTMNTWMANEIEARYAKSGVHAVSLQPAFSFGTGLGQDFDPKVLKTFTDDPGFQARLKSQPQGAATTVYAATAKELEGVGGVWLDNCRIQRQVWDQKTLWASGHSPWAFEPENQKKLWDISLRLVGEAE